MAGDLPKAKEITDEIEQIRLYKQSNGKLFDETQLTSQGILFVNPADVMMGGGMDDTIDVQEEFELLEKEGRTA